MPNRRLRRRQVAYDAAWKQFFALSIMVEHLLHGFAGAIAELLDFSTLRDVAGEWVQDGRRRRSDAVWRVDYRDGSDRSLIVMLEFQSTVDSSMARRVLRIVGMAYEKLRRNRQLDPDGRLRVLCVVISSGVRAWTAPGAASRVAVSANGEVLSLLSQPYVALDARGGVGEHLPERNFVASLFALTASSTVAEVLDVLRDLGRWLSDEAGDQADPVSAVYGEWLATCMPRLFLRSRASALLEQLTQGKTEDQSMTALAERMEREAAQWRRRVKSSRQEGRREGRQEGRQEGMELGLAHERSLLRQLAARKFGDATGDRLARRLVDVSDTDRLAEVGALIIECDSSASFLERISLERP
ncbi:MAG: Rpn family recombination-promoting nuclease/putative transposase [Gammaproteobacteria bacterium]|nr:Rpn family recombination-promoting nuclease/putative transposase [Gammaproteobacteria bacterium]